MIMKLMQENHLVKNFRAMTNKEKAEALRKTALPNPLHNGYSMWLSSTDVDKILIEMAKWKDEQYAKTLAPILIELDELKHQIKSLLP